MTTIINFENLKKCIDKAFEDVVDVAMKETMKEIDEMGKEWMRDYCKRQMKILMKEFRENQKILKQYKNP